MLMVTGGAGFIGSNFVLSFLAERDEEILNVDKLSYAGNLCNLKLVENDERHIFYQGDIGNRFLIGRLLEEYSPRAIVHFAAETHVDRSIHDPEPFFRSNVHGTMCLLAETLAYWNQLSKTDKEHFRFLHVSTDEVYGSLGPNDLPFSEESQYAPNSPYSASKAASDHLVRAYHRTYGLPIIITHCSNNYGPYQLPEKFIPLIISNVLEQKVIPVYGDGRHERNWIHVSDHCEALRVVLERGNVGETYNIGAARSKTNMEVVTTVCSVLDSIKPSENFESYTSLITHVEDRLGHDFRYDINSSKIEEQLGWRPKETFMEGIYKTVAWYFDNEEWLKQVSNKEHKKWLKMHYGNLSKDEDIR